MLFLSCFELYSRWVPLSIDLIPLNYVVIALNLLKPRCLPVVLVFSLMKTVNIESLKALLISLIKYCGLKFYYQITRKISVASFTDNIIMQINFLTIFRIPSSTSVVIVIIYISWEISI